MSTLVPGHTSRILLSALYALPALLRNDPVVAETLNAPADPPADGAAGAGASSSLRSRVMSVRWEFPAVFLITLAVLATLTPRVATFLDPLTGDEPFYVMTAISIWQDHDLNECNNYRQQDESQIYPANYAQWKDFPVDWKGWTGAPYPLPPHPAKLVPDSRMCTALSSDVPLPADGTHSELYSKHGLGLSLIVLPSFVMGGRTLVVYFLNVLGALLALNVYMFAREGTGKVVPAVLTWLAFTFTVPQLPYSFLIFPELPAALLTLYAFRRIRAGGNNAWQVAAAGFCMAFLPWLHYRFAPVTIGLLLYFIYREVSARSANRANRTLNLALVLSQVALSGGLLMLFFYSRYAQVLPNASDHAGISDVAGTLRGAAGTLLDEQWGLLIAAPIFVLTIVGVALMGMERAWRKDLLWLGIVFVPYFLVVVNYAQWWGEWCPPARYIASVLPLLALPFAYSLDAIKGLAYKTIYAGLLLISLAVSVGFMYQPQWMYNQPNGKSELLDKGLPQLLAALHITLPAGFAATNLFPSFVVPYFGYTMQGQDSGDYWSAQAWKVSQGPALFFFAVILASLGLFWVSRRRWSPPMSGEQAGPVVERPVEQGEIAPITVRIARRKPILETPTNKDHLL